MKYFVILLLLVKIPVVHAQEASAENMILQLVQHAVEENKLPPEIVNVKGSTGFPHNVVVIQATIENGLDHGIYLKRDDVDYRIWKGEKLFIYDPYWIAPSNIIFKGTRGSFRFETKFLNLRNKACYSGKIKGMRKMGEWRVVSSSFKRIKCKLDNETYK